MKLSKKALFKIQKKLPFLWKGLGIGKTIES